MKSFPILKSKKSKIVTAILAIIVLITLFGIYQFAKSYPLGNQLNYIGKHDYGCWLICDAVPDSTYYYATNLNFAELSEYFPNAEITSFVDDSYGSNGYAYILVKFKNSKTNDTFFIKYIDNGAAAAERHGLGELTKKHIITIRGSEYRTVQQSL